MRRPARKHLTAIGLMLAEEITAGVLIGAMARIIMSSLQVAGFLIATQTGLADAQTVDPAMGGQSVVHRQFHRAAGRPC